MTTPRLKVALVHYWLVTWRGGEKVLEALAEMFPDADIFVHVFNPEVVERSPLKGRNIRTTFIHRLPFAVRFYQKYLPLMPLAIEQLDLSAYDLVISSESGPVKGLILPPNVMHICYCHTPMRYVWDMYHDYLRNSGWLTRFMMRLLIHYIRQWDRASADRVDHFLTNSRFVSARVEKFYRRNSTVIPPPVDMREFRLSSHDDGFYLMVGALVRYKKADLAVKAFNQLGLPLIVIGEGELAEELKRVAKPNVKILGRQPRAVVIGHYQRCRALIFPGIEDFGIVPLEAMASGKPVVAFAGGGAMETVIEGVTGVHFAEQTEESLIGAVERIERGDIHFDPALIRAHAAAFDLPRFKEEVLKFIRDRLGFDPISAQRGSKTVVPFQGRIK